MKTGFRFTIVNDPSVTFWHEFTFAELLTTERQDEALLKFAQCFYFWDGR